MPYQMPLYSLWSIVYHYFCVCIAWSDGILIIKISFLVLVLHYYFLISGLIFLRTLFIWILMINLAIWLFNCPMTFAFIYSCSSGSVMMIYTFRYFTAVIFIFVFRRCYCYWNFCYSPLRFCPFVSVRFFVNTDWTSQFNTTGPVMLYAL